MKTKTYKLIKCYPDSPELGYIIKPKDGNNYYWNHAWFNPADFPEFWKEVIEAPKYIKLLDSDYLKRNSWYRVEGVIYKVDKWNNGSVWVECNVDIKDKDGKWKAGSSLCMDALYNHPEYYVEVTKEDYEEQVVPEYVKCKHEYGHAKIGTIYKTSNKEEAQKLFSLTWKVVLIDCAHLNKQFIPSTKEEYEAQFIPDYVGTYFTNEVSSRVYLIKSEVDSTISIFWETGSTTYLKETVDKFFKEGCWLKSTKDDYNKYWKLGKYAKPLFTTHDGVDIYKGDPFYAYDTSRNKILTYHGEPFVADKGTPYPPVSHELYFSTLDAIEKYKKESAVFVWNVAYVNKPTTYTLEEIGEVIEKKIGWDVLWKNRIKPELIEFKK